MEFLSMSCWIYEKDITYLFDDFYGEFGVGLTFGIIS